MLLWNTKSDCTLPIAHQAIVCQQVFNNQTIPQVSEAQKHASFRTGSHEIQTQAQSINSTVSSKHIVNPGYNSLRVFNLINQTQPKVQQHG